jgi:hypothetical protein
MAENIDISSTDKTTPAATAKTLMNDAWAANVDTENAQQLTNLAFVRQGRVNQLQREAAALATEFGAADAAVVTLNDSIKVQQSLTSVLGATRDIAATPSVTVPKNGWVLQGHIRDGGLSPIATLSVCLVDEQKNFLSAYGYAYTDDTGYYIITYTPDPAAPTPSPLTAYLEVLNSSSQAIYIDAASFTLNPGTNLTRDLMLASQTPLGTPPGTTPTKTPKPKRSTGA